MGDAAGSPWFYRLTPPSWSSSQKSCHLLDGRDEIPTRENLPRDKIETRKTARVSEGRRSRDEQALDENDGAGRSDARFPRFDFDRLRVMKGKNTMKKLLKRFQRIEWLVAGCGATMALGLACNSATSSDLGTSRAAITESECRAENGVFVDGQCALGVVNISPDDDGECLPGDCACDPHGISCTATGGFEENPGGGGVDPGPVDFGGGPGGDPGGVGPAPAPAGPRSFTRTAARDSQGAAQSSAETEASNACIEARDYNLKDDPQATECKHVRTYCDSPRTETRSTGNYFPPWTKTVTVYDCSATYQYFAK
jgi:hypothetical protein